MPRHKNFEIQPNLITHLSLWWTKVPQPALQPKLGLRACKLAREKKCEALVNMFKS